VKGRAAAISWTEDAYAILSAMKGGQRPLGYTIVEVMIVLAISGVMFVIAATFISGKEARTAFTSGTNDFSSQMQTTISQVVNGQFSDVALGCTVGASLSFSTSGNQGTNAPCVFVGKFLHFSESGDATKYEVFSLAGARDVTTLNGPPPVTPVLGGGADLTQQQLISQSLSVNSPIKVTDAAGVVHSTYGFGYVQSLGTSNGSGGFNSGGQTVGMVYASGLGSNNADEATAAADITGTLLPAVSASVCLTDGTRYAQILVGSSNDQLTVSVKVVTVPC
jgi:prepilin-type N-terminal cleavage/methylation domain-containing protein